MKMFFGRQSNLFDLLLMKTKYPSMLITEGRSKRFAKLRDREAVHTFTMSMKLDPKMYG
ncbi:MAG: hypothetical protein KDH90_09015 [Anaerolineae bacterium]|nr:hypothetical protein [Anaerolineae bacterium]